MSEFARQHISVNSNDPERSRWILEQMATMGNEESLGTVLPAGQAKVGGLLIVTLKQSNRPKDLNKFFEIISKYNSDTAGNVLGEVICLVDDASLKTEVAKAIGTKLGFKLAQRSSFFSPEHETAHPLRLEMAELRKVLLGLGVDESRLAHAKIVAPIGTERDYDGLGETSPWRQTPILFVNELLEAVELNKDLENKISEMTAALDQV